MKHKIERGRPGIFFRGGCGPSYPGQGTTNTTTLYARTLCICFAAYKLKTGDRACRGTIAVAQLALWFGDFRLFRLILSGDGKLGRRTLTLRG